MKILLADGPHSTFLLCAENGRTALVQTDWDYPGVAARFGWSPCACGATDGTVDCDHQTARDMIAAAREFLETRIGETIDDPGYF